MLKNRRLLLVSTLMAVFLAVAAPSALAKPGEHEAIAKHFKSKYAAKKVSVPFMWLARAAVKSSVPLASRVSISRFSRI